MPIVNYVREHIRFMEYACDEKLSSSERLLWYALMHIMNQRAQGNVWPDDFIRISNERLLSLCPMKFDTMANARNGLKQRGLIEIEKGEKNKKSPAYRMIYFFPQYLAPDTEQDCYSENSDNMGYNMGGNMGYNTGGNMGYNRGANTGDFSINYTDRRIQPRNPNVLEDEDDEEEENRRRVYARACEETRTAFKKHFGFEATPALLQRIARIAVTSEFYPGVIDLGILFAAQKGANNPIDYLVAVLVDWAKNNIKTTADVDEYQFLHDATSGRLTQSLGIIGSEFTDQLKGFRQDRETPEQRRSREQREAREADELEKRRAEIAANKKTREEEEYARKREKLDREYGVS